MIASWSHQAVVDGMSSKTIACGTYWRDDTHRNDQSAEQKTCDRASACDGAEHASQHRTSGALLATP